MSRNKRSFVKNGIYHISQRSVKGCYAFQKPYDKAILLNLMESVKIGHPFVLLYYAVMDNHAHFLIRVTDGDPSIIFGQIYRKFACYKFLAKTHKLAYGMKVTILWVDFNIEQIYYICIKDNCYE